VAAIAGALVLAGWLAAPTPSRAVAQIPDSGKQRHEMIVELRRSNDQLAQVVKLLTEMRDQGKQPEPKGG
jgi:hypothetical protein